MSSRRLLSRRRFVPLAPLLAALLLSACASLPLSRSYLGDTNYGTSVIAPGDWRGFDAAAVLGDVPASAPSYIEAFGPEGVDPTRPMLGLVPGGMLVVNVHPGLETARRAARNALLTDLDAAVASGAAVILEESEPVVEGAYERRRVLLEVRADAISGTPQDNELPPGTMMRVLQETMTGTRAVGKSADGAELFPVKTLLLGCSQECFAQNASVIRDISASWRVE